MESAQFLIETIGDLDHFAARLLGVLPQNSILALTGKLGAGKTAFAQAMARALGIDAPVTSPTFTLVNEYLGTRKMIHSDWYRLESAEDIRELGLSDYFSESSTVILVEWADRYPEFFPDQTIWLDFYVAANHRVVTLKGGSDEWHEQLKETM